MTPVHAGANGQVGMQKGRKTRGFSFLSEGGFALALFYLVLIGHVFYLATNKHLKYETQGEVASLA